MGASSWVRGQEEKNYKTKTTEIIYQVWRTYNSGLVA
jgi:hypothetical protein